MLPSYAYLSAVFDCEQHRDDLFDSRRCAPLPISTRRWPSSPISFFPAVQILALVLEPCADLRPYHLRPCVCNMLVSLWSICGFPRHYNTRDYADRPGVVYGHYFEARFRLSRGGLLAIG